MIGNAFGTTCRLQSTARYATSQETERVSAARVGASIGADIAPENAIAGKDGCRRHSSRPAGARLNRWRSGRGRRVPAGRDR